MLHTAQADKAVSSPPTAVAAASADADPGDENINTFFRTQDNITTTDASSEKDIPGLAETDYKKVWRAAPNLEHWSPLITAVTPFLPTMKYIALAMQWYFPMAWPLAGPSGEHKDWLSTAFSMYGNAIMGRGPRPLVYPTILIPSDEVSFLAFFSLLSNVCDFLSVCSALSVVCFAWDHRSTH